MTWAALPGRHYGVSGTAWPGLLGPRPFSGPCPLWGPLPRPCTALPHSRQRLQQTHVTSERTCSPATRRVSTAAHLGPAPHLGTPHRRAALVRLSRRGPQTAAVTLTGPAARRPARVSAVAAPRTGLRTPAPELPGPRQDLDSGCPLRPPAGFDCVDNPRPRQPLRRAQTPRRAPAGRPLTPRARSVRRLALPRPSQPPLPMRPGRPSPDVPMREEAALRPRLTDQSKVSIVPRGRGVPGRVLTADWLPTAGRPGRCPCAD